MYYVRNGKTLIGPYLKLSTAAFAANGAGYPLPDGIPVLPVYDHAGKLMDISRYSFPEKRARTGFFFGMHVSVHNPQGGYAAIQRPVHRGDWIRAMFGRYS